MWEGTIPRTQGGRSPARLARASTAAVMLAIFLSAAWGPSAIAQYNPKKAIWGPPDQITVGGKRYDAFAVYKDMGIGIYSIAIDWSKVAPGSSRPAGDLKDPANPVYRWPTSISLAVSKADQQSAADPTHPIRVNIEITKAPDWANGNSKANNRVGMRNYAPLNPSDYGDFATAVARRYPSVHLWMIWGEPSRQGAFCPFNKAPYDFGCFPSGSSKPGSAHWSAKTLTDTQAFAPRRYAELVEAAWAALHSKSLPGNEQNQVIAGDTEPAGDIMPGMWVRYMKLKDPKTGKYTIPPRMDMYGHNPFPMSGRFPAFSQTASPQNLMDFSDLTRLRSLVNSEVALPRGKQSLPLFLAEFCIPTGTDDGEFAYWVPTSKLDKRYSARTDGRDVQDDWISSALSVASQTSWISGLGWIHIADSEPGALYVNWNKAHPNNKRYDPLATRAGLFFTPETYRSAAKTPKATPGFEDFKKPGFFAFKNG